MIEKKKKGGENLMCSPGFLLNYFLRMMNAFSHRYP